MSDVDDITALVHSYAFLLDRGESDAVAALFEHSTWRSDLERPVLRGSDAVRPIYERLKTNDGSRTKHLLTNLTVDVQPQANTASAHCYWTVLKGDAPGRPINIVLSGQYEDRFEKVDDVWRFSDRLIQVDLPFTESPLRPEASDGIRKQATRN